MKNGLDATASAIAEKSANDLVADLAEEPKQSQTQGPELPAVPGIGENRADAPAKIPFGKMTGKMLADEEAAIRDAKVGELIAAGSPRERAKAEATVYARAARVAATKRRMSPLEWEESRGATVRKGADVDKASFNQPIDASVNPDERVPVLDISGAMGAAETATNKDILDYLRSLINRGTMIPKDASAFVNIPLKRDGQRHIVASSWNPKTEEGRRTRKTALLSLPELVQNAVFIERKENTDTTEKPNVEEYVRFYIPVKRGESVHTIRLVTEKRKGSDSLAPVEVDLYDVIVEKKESRPPVTPADSAVSTSVVTGPGSASSMTIRRMLAGVKDMDGNEYFPTSDIQRQEDGKESSVRGSISFDRSGKAIISLFESANESTFMHEAAHLFLQDFLDASNSRALDELGVADFRALDVWLGGFKRGKDGKLTASTKQHEQFARGFERYLRDGKAPSPSLKAAFERFREWLRQVYRKATDLGVRMKPEVRSIYDSFLTTKEERARGATETKKMPASLPQDVDSKNLVAGAVAGTGIVKESPGAGGEGFDSPEATRQEPTRTRLKTGAGDSDGNIALQGERGKTEDLEAAETGEGEEKISRWAGQTGQEMPTGQLIGRLNQSLPTEKGSVKSGGEPSDSYRLAPEDSSDDSPERRLQIDAARFGKAVDDFVADRLAKDNPVNVMRTPLALQLSGADDLPVTISVDALGKILKGKHKEKMTPELLKRIPEAIADPLMILEMQPNERLHRLEGNRVVLVELADKKGNPINVTFLLSKRGDKRGYLINEITSVYGRETKDTGIPNNKWFIDEASKTWMDERENEHIQLKYINTKKTSEWSQATGLEVPTAGIIRRFNRIVPTKIDLVKLRERHPGNYRLGMRDSEHPVTLEGLRGSVPGAKVTDLGDGKYRLDLHNGESITVSTVEEIEMDPDVVRRDYGREPGAGEIVAGASRTIDGRRFIELAEGIAGEGTLDHELFETARNMVLTAEEKDILDREIGSTEEQAEAYREFQANRKGAMTGRIVRVFQKIKDFFGAIRARLFGKKSLDVFREIAQGKVWEREARAGARSEVEARLKEDAAKFSASVDAFVAGKLNPRQPIPVMTTPLALHLAGADLLPIRIGVRTLAKILKGKHYGAISPSLLKQIPEALADPVMLLKLKPTNTRPENSIVAMLDLYDSRGNTINVPVSLNRKTGSNAYELNEISSVFGREFPDGKGPNHAWFLNEATRSYIGEDGRTERQLKYLNKEKISRWAGQTGQEMPTGQLLGRLDQSIPAEEDLVKLKTQKPEHYSLSERASGGPQDNRVTDQVEKGNLRYIDKQKSSRWATLSGQTLSDGTSLSTWMDMGNFLKQNIHTEEDLVKAREQGRTRYSLTQKPSGATQEWEPVVKGLDRVVSPQQRKLSFIERIQAARHWWQTEMMDDISPIRDYFGKDIYIKTTNAIHGINSRAQALIEFGDKANGVKSLFDIFGAIPQNEHDGLTHYAVYKHLLDIAGNSEGAERLAAPLARLAKEATDKAKELETTLPKDEFHHRDLLDSAKAYRELARDYEEQVKSLTEQIKVTKANAAQYKAAIARMDQLYPSWAGAQRDLVAYSQHLLKKLRSAGIVSDDLFTLLTQKYPNYIPLQRDFGTEEGVASFVRTRGLVNLASPIKRLKGSKRDVLDPLLQIISNTYVVESLVGKQNAARDIAEMADRAELLGLVEPTTDRHHGPDEYVFHVWENGKKKFYTTTPDIYAALVMSSGSPKDNVLTKILSAPVKALRAGVTHGVGFILRNPIRDTINAGVVGEHFTPVIDSLKGMFHVWKQDAVFEEFMKSGAMQGLAYMSEASRAEMARKIRQGRGKTRFLNKMKHPISTLWDALGDAAQLTELGTRVGQYQKMRDRGESMERSAFVSRDLINYLRGGRTSKMITKLNPFFNAQLQGVAKGLRSFYHDGKIDTGTIARAMLYITLPSMLTCFWNLGGDDDRRKKYLSIPAWQRNLFWNIVVGKGEDAWVIKIPKPFDLGVVFGSIPERFVDYLHANDKKAFDGIGVSLFNALSPEVAPLFMGLPFELNANYSMFYERSIVPQSQTGLYPKLQYGAYTSEWAKWAGEKFNLSPRKLEYAVLQLTGNLGKETSNLADMVFRAVTEETRPAREWYQQTPGVSAFAVPAKSMKRWEQTFQDEHEELNTLYKSAKQIYENSGSKALTVQERRILGAENGVKQVNQLFTNKGGVNDLRREISKITVAKNMSAEEKRARVDRLEKRIGELSERGLAYIDRIKKSMNRGG